MCPRYSSVTLFVFVLVFQNGRAVFQCPVAAVSSLIYLDLEQLSLIALQQGGRDVIQLPTLCVKGNDEECRKQQCCHNEVGCCYIDPRKHIRKCGCKIRGTQLCTFPAPLAILANSKCSAGEKTKISGCLRETRENEETSIIFTRNSTLQSATQSSRSAAPKKTSLIFERVTLGPTD